MLTSETLVCLQRDDTAVNEESIIVKKQMGSPCKSFGVPSVDPKRNSEDAEEEHRCYIIQLFVDENCI